MKIVLGVLVALIGLAGIAFGLQVLAAESGEVVVLGTSGPEGPHETRLWIVDADGAQWLRAGHAGAGWAGHIAADPSVSVTRGGASASYTAVPVPEATPRINALMAEKYGWADAYIGFLYSRTEAVAIRLDPR
ncbi:MAG: hypothetical protein HXY25_00440 [Alphaproteobacteria bacterium]|nr:hypothetical protein [Alphaproteobacteria bacterium]